MIYLNTDYDHGEGTIILDTVNKSVSEEWDAMCLGQYLIDVGTKLKEQKNICEGIEVEEWKSIDGKSTKL